MSDTVPYHRDGVVIENDEKVDSSTPQFRRAQMLGKLRGPTGPRHPGQQMFAFGVADTMSCSQVMCPTAKPATPKQKYTPLGSVWNGEDAELLEKMLSFYPRKRPKRILDATVNGGRFWKGSERPITGLDISIQHKPNVVGDNARMPFKAEVFDVVVYDPPHIPNQGKDNEKDFNTRFGLVLRSSKENAYTFTHTYPPFAKEAYRVLRPEGILLCKITDYVHHHRYNWAHLDFIQVARETGFRPCDCIIKVRKGPIIDPKWKTAHHTRRQHCYWLVFRKSAKCE